MSSENTEMMNVEGVALVTIGPAISVIPKVATLRSRIIRAEQEMIKLPQVEIVPNHYFIPGMYIREITIPKDVIVIGKTHRTNHVSIMVSGVMSVVTEDGVKMIKPPYVHVGSKGTKRMGYTHEESRWITLHNTDETDLDVIEKEEFIEEEGEVNILDFKTGKVKPEYQVSIDGMEKKLDELEEGVIWQE